MLTVAYLYVRIGTLSFIDGGFRPYNELGQCLGTFRPNEDGDFVNENTLHFLQPAYEGGADMYGLYISHASDVPFVFGRLQSTNILHPDVRPIITAGRLRIERDLLYSADWS